MLIRIRLSTARHKSLFHLVRLAPVVIGQSTQPRHPERAMSVRLRQHMRDPILVLGLPHRPRQNARAAGRAVGRRESRDRNANLQKTERKGHSAAISRVGSFSGPVRIE